MFDPGAKKAQLVGSAVGEILMIVLIVALYLYRVRDLQLHRLKSIGLSFSRILINLIYGFGALFTLTAFLFTLISGIKNDDLCYAAVILCFAFYLGAKLLLYMFLCERLRAIRQAVVERCADILWQRCLWGVLVIFGQIAIICFHYPLHAMKKGYCVIGLPVFIIAPLLAFDILCNLTISYLFFKQSRAMFSDVLIALIPPNVKRYLYPRLVTVDGTRAFTISKNINEMTTTDVATTMMAAIVRKTLATSIIILFSTIINLALLIHYDGIEHGWLCFLLCSMDITWNILCFTYLIGLPTSGESDDGTVLSRSQADTLSTFGFSIQQSHPFTDIGPAYRVRNSAGIYATGANYDMDDLGVGVRSLSDIPHASSSVLGRDNDERSLALD